MIQLEIPSTVTIIDDGAFTGCSGLAEILPPGVFPTIGAYALSPGVGGFAT